MTLSKNAFLFFVLAIAVCLPTLLIAQTAEAAADMAAETAPGFWALLFSKGGVVTWVIALLSAVGLPIAAIKLYEFYRMDIFRPHAFEEALGDMRRGKTAGLGARLDALAHPAAPLIAFALSQSSAARLAPAVLRAIFGASFIAPYLGARIDRRLSPIVRPIGHGARHDHRFSRRRPGGWRG